MNAGTSKFHFNHMIEQQFLLVEDGFSSTFSTCLVEDSAFLVGDFFLC